MFIQNTLLLICCYTMVFIIAWLSKVNKAQQLVHDNGMLTSNPGYLTGAHIFGIFWLGLVPATMLSRPGLQVLLSPAMPDSAALISFFIILMMAITIINRHSKNVLRRITHPRENMPYLTQAFFFRYFFIRIVFLFCYELWFRGFLLFENINQLGMVPAVVINVFAYVLLHIFKSKKEILACIPFGTAACCLSILFKAAWPAIILHISVSMAYELNIYRTYTLSILNKIP